jgi:hypothetical protein
VTTLAPAERGTGSRVVAHDVSPLLLAEEILAVLTVAGDGPGVAPSEDLPQSPPAELPLGEWAARILQCLKDAE